MGCTAHQCQMFRLQSAGGRHASRRSQGPRCQVGENGHQLQGHPMAGEIQAVIYYSSSLPFLFLCTRTVSEAVSDNSRTCNVKPRWAALSKEYMSFAKCVEAGDSKMQALFHKSRMLTTELLRAVFLKYDGDENGSVRRADPYVELSLCGAEFALPGVGLATPS